jgi:hypothetical protein
MLESAARHALMGGKLHVYRRENSGQWQCSTYLAGKNHRVATKTDSLAHAKAFAEDGYLERHGKPKRGKAVAEKTSAGCVVEAIAFWLLKPQSECGIGEDRS